MNLEQCKAPIKLYHELPPIPIRDFDWCAYRDGYEENGDYGYGRTQEEAIANLLALEQEYLDNGT